jgi:pyruvate/2-oxoglutarate/acetoin dehydrogenase E1 component
MAYTKYHKEICNQMNLFAEDNKVIFLGQQVASEDFYNTLTDVPMHSRREMGVCEDLQLGVSIGMALEGYLPISIYQRIDFIPRAMDQLINHLNIINCLSRGKFNPKVIIRTTIGTDKPLDCGLQHRKDLTKLMKVAVDFPVYLVTTPQEVKKAYDYARKSNESVMIIERQDKYYE